MGFVVKIHQIKSLDADFLIKAVGVDEEISILTFDNAEETIARRLALLRQKDIFEVKGVMIVLVDSSCGVLS